MTIQENIGSLLEGSKGTWGVYAKNLISDETIFEVNGNNWFPAASISKVSICLFALHQIEIGKEESSNRLNLKDELKLGGSGILQFIDGGLNPTLLDVVKFCLILSDNTAAKMLVRHFTPQAINDYLSNLGFVTTKLKIDGETFGFGLTTPREMSSLFEGLYNNRFLNQDNSMILLEILKKTNSDLRIRRYLPRYVDESNKERLRVAGKGGTLPGVCSDVGIIFGKQPYVLAVLSKDLPDETFGPDNPTQFTIAKIAQAVNESL